VIASKEMTEINC